MTLLSRLLLVTAVLGLAGCPDDDDASTPDAGRQADAGGADAGGGLCDAIDCGDGGRCVVVDGLPACDCDPGYEAQGFACVSASDPDQPPADFVCPAPGGAGDLVATLEGGRWAFVQSDRSCTISGTKDILAFRDDGIFTIHSQFGDARPGAGGTLLYGCWSVVETGADRVRITYDYANQTSRNCGAIGAYADPPACAGAVAFSAADDALLLIESEEQNQERILLFRVPAAADCVFCGDDGTCCPRASWVADRDGPLCD
ncbi:MAG: hypothetical protein KC549_07540 [Myxococcales bacterium]|nr:hypothetical protein [Myxococcales bacterium]MCB9549249.1 hypothetical protein [Myxococcales bacterium]